MKEWYLTNSPPNVTSGYEDDAISEYAQSNFTDVLETMFSDKVLLCNSDLTEQTEIKCIVQGNMATSQSKTIERSILFPIGSSVVGKYIYYDNSYWLLTGYPGNNKSYEKILATLCTFKLRWQNSFGDIIERWLAPTNITNSASGIDENNTLAVINNYYYFYIPTDIETKKLNHDMRFPIDFDDAIEPEIYSLDNKKLLGTNYQNSNKGGTLLITAKFDAFNKDTDKQVILEDGTKVWIADYISPIPVEPTTPTDINAIISGRTSLNVGYSRTYSVSFKDADGNILSDVIYTWNLVSSFNDKIVSTEIDGKITLTINDQTLVGQTFKLQVIVDGNVLSEITINVSQSLY